MLLDSDCLPVTLFLKIFGLRPFWPDSQLIQMVDSPRHTHCLPSNASAQILKLSTRSIVSAVRAWGRVVTEPHSELDAGLIVVFRSSHPSLFDWKTWTLRFRGSPGSIPDVEFGEEASKLAVAFGAE